jgi:gamma-glutamylcyclotransferase (GGCT)/AIG2-like uncharacterized protein YtfP
MLMIETQEQSVKLVNDGGDGSLPTSSQHTIFVYGTLRKGQYLNSILAGADYIGEGVTPRGYALIDLGAFPGLIEWTDDTRVEGDLYTASNALLKRLDQVESEGYLYLRHPLSIRTEEGSSIPTLTYLLHPQIVKEYNTLEIKKMLVSSRSIKAKADGTISWYNPHPNPNSFPG